MSVHLLLFNMIGEKYFMVSHQVYSIGHSNHTVEYFLSLLKTHQIGVLLDVRSAPFSRYSPQFNRSPLQEAVVAAAIKYGYFGRELGGRPMGNGFYDETGRVLYQRLAESPLFLEGIQWVERGVQGHRLVLMCSEENPTSCHRRLLIAKVLAARGILTMHIRGNGRLQTETELEEEAGSLQGEGQQLSFLEDEQERSWKSVRSVLPKSQRQPSSEH